MRNKISMESSLLIILTLLFTFHQIHSFSNFKCLNKKGNAPSLPQSYSANIRINYLLQQYSVEVKYATNEKEGKEFIEFKRQDRHVQYINRKDKKSLLFIQYKEDEHPTCTVTKSTDTKEFLKSEDAGENQIFLKAIEVMMYPDKYDIATIEPSLDTGVYAMRYEGCLSDPKINVSISFAANDWKHTHTSSLVKNVNYPEMAVAENGNVVITALYSYFDPSTPDDAIFQPPADVYCKGFRDDKKPPTLTDYFSYNAEIIVDESAKGIAPIVSHRKVYYDYPSSISRIDLYDPLAEDSDMFSRVTAQEKSIIHDFNSGLQYIFDPFTGRCTIDTFKATFNAISSQITEDNKMLSGSEYFWLNEGETSYNGQFPVRGMTADVYTAVKVDPATKKRFVVSWYFSTEETQVVENENVEKNVLLRMYVQPETDMEKESVVLVNFYNFVREEPKVNTYDLTSCFNESSSKILVFTFPAIESLRGSEKMIGMLIHLAIKDATGVKKQRINMKEVIFSGGYMYAEFSLLEDSPSGSNKEISLDDALKKLKTSVSSGNFTVKVPTKKETVTLRPEPNGLNVFAGDRVKKPAVEGYKEGSVISLTIGMLILGFLLGCVTLNLVMSRKFGISLFQKSQYDHSGFNNPLNESSM